MLAPVSVAAVAFLLSTSPANAQARATSLDTKLRTVLRDAGFTGTIESQLEDRLGVDALDTELIGLGGFLFFDPALSLHNDTSCASCHSPAFGWGDSQSIAIGVQSNYVVGPDRTGPRNLRRSPMTANTAFYPALMWDGRFFAPSGDPFDDSAGFEFPAPEGTTAFPADDPNVTHLLEAQAFLPVTELVEMAGFTGLADSELDDEFDVFDDSLGEDVPDLDASGYRHEPIRQAVLDRLNSYTEYGNRFTSYFGTLPADGIEYWMVARALAEFQFNQVAADAPLDQYARGTDNSLLTDTEKRGALIFFGKGECVSCHAVAGDSNEMFSDFETHVIAVPQVAPEFGVDSNGVGLGNVVFDGTDRDEDYGHERTTGNSADRYMFRTAPLRNLARSPAYFHNGAFTDLEDAIRHHLDVDFSQTNYDPVAAGLAPDIDKLGPVIDMTLVDAALDPAPALTDADIRSLVTFVRDALLDPKSAPGKQCAAKPNHVPSHMTMETFEGCPTGHGH
jgi:cytochrome c peroxidase